MSARPALIGIPYDASSSFLRGAAEAPTAIREELFSPAGNGFSECGIDVCHGALEDAGDLRLPQSGAEMRQAIERGVAEVLDSRRRPIALGGDHSVTYPILRAFRDRPRSLTVPTDVIRPPSTATSARNRAPPDPSITSPPRITRSWLMCPFSRGSTRPSRRRPP